MFVIGSLASIMRGRNVFMEEERGLRNSTPLTWIWNRAEHSRVHAVKKSCKRRMWCDKMGG